MAARAGIHRGLRVESGARQLLQVFSPGQPIAIDEQSALLVEADGKATVVGTGKGAYFLRPLQSPEICQKGFPFTFWNVSVCRVPAGGHFDLRLWTGDGGTPYSLSEERGKIESTQTGKGIY